ncbi:MAG: MFS transporter [Vulcanisaeta sp.]
MSQPGSSGVQKEMLVGELFEYVKSGRIQWFVGSVLFFAFAIEAWEFMIPSFLLSALMSYFHVGYDIGGLLLSAPFFGALLGSYAVTWIPDVYGRKRAIQWGIIGYSLAGIITAFAPPTDYWWFFWSRFVAGIFLVLVMGQPFPYLEEFMPVKSRGRVTVYLASGWPIGTLMAVGAAYLEPWIHWQGVILVSVAAMLIWLVPVSLLPESPYYLVAAGKEMDAKKILKRVLGEDLYNKLNVDNAKLKVEERRRGNVIELFRGGLLKNTLFIFFVNVFYSFAYWGLFLWLPTILLQRGLTFVGTLEFVIAAALAQFPAYFVAAYLAETRLGRRITTISFMIIAGVFTFLFASASTLTDLLVYLVLLSFFNLGAWGVWDAWEPEMYPTPIRGILMGWVTGAQRIANAIAPVVIGALLAIHGITFTEVVLTIAVSAWISALLALPLPETRGKILR